MSIKIGASIPCNTIGFLSNKEEKPLKLKIDNGKIANRYDDIGIVVLKPEIDRIVFGFSPTAELLKKYDPTQDLAEYMEYIKGSLYQDAVTDSTATNLSLVKNVPFKKKPWSSYNVNLYYTPHGSSERILIQIDPKNKNGKLDFMRFDFNPNRFDGKALATFRNFIEETLVTAVAPIPYEEFLIYSRIYRVDICVDVLGARPSDLEIRPMANYKSSPKKSSNYKSKTGRVETVYPKAKQTKSSAEYVYDKRQEQIDNEKEPFYGEFLHSRYECRAEKTTFFKLAALKNRCSRIAVKALDIRKFNKMKHTQKLFVRYALDRNLDKALDLIPDKLKAGYKKDYEGVMRDIWGDPKKLWSHWKGAVETSGLFPPTL